MHDPTLPCEAWEAAFEHAAVPQALIVADGNGPRVVRVNCALRRLAGADAEADAHVVFRGLCGDDGWGALVARLPEVQASAWEGCWGVPHEAYGFTKLVFDVRALGAASGGPWLWQVRQSSLLDCAMGVPAGAMRAAGGAPLDGDEADALAASRAQWRAIVEAVPDQVLVTSRSGLIEYMNRASAGVAPERVLGTPFVEHLLPEHREAAAVSLAQVVQRGEADVFEAEAQAPDGLRRWLSVRVGPVVWGGCVDRLIIIVTDITPAHRALAKTAGRPGPIVDGARGVGRSGVPEGP
jgi:PAS domain S-box-containing protein